MLTCHIGQGQLKEEELISKMSELSDYLPLVSGTKELMLPSSVYDCIIEMRYFQENKFPLTQESRRHLDNANSAFLSKIHRWSKTNGEWSTQNVSVPNNELQHAYPQTPSDYPYQLGLLPVEERHAKSEEYSKNINSPKSADNVKCTNSIKSMMEAEKLAHLTSFASGRPMNQNNVVIPFMRHQEDKRGMYKIKQFTNSGTGRKNKIYTCTYPECNREFYKKWNCTEHYKTHTKEKPFECFICGMYFAQKGSLFKHIKAKSKRGDDHGYTFFMEKYHGKRIVDIV